MLDAISRWWRRSTRLLPAGKDRPAAGDGAGDQASTQEAGHDEGELALVEQARREWLAARSMFDNVLEPELIDHAIHRIMAAERRYIFLLKQARQDGLNDYQLGELIDPEPGRFPA